MKVENIEKLGELKDTIDNLHSALQIPMSAQFHIEQIQRELIGLAQAVRDIYIDETGNDPWAY